ncbi:MAG: iron-containing redox enzyme family protein [Myxococcota bacterium]
MTHADPAPTPAPTGGPGFQAELEQLAAALVDHHVFSIPNMRAFHAGTWTDLALYRRHMTEAVLRIRLNNEVDAYCLYKIARRDVPLAQKLARYLAEEFGHEFMFGRDLEALGVSAEALEATEVFPATRMLIGFLHHTCEVDDGMSTMVWNWFVEWYSDRYNGAITARAAEAFGHGTTRGAAAHLAIDERSDHEGLMFSTVRAVIRRPGDEDRVRQYLGSLVDLVGQYFRQLVAATLPVTPTAELHP